MYKHYWVSHGWKSENFESHDNHYFGYFLESYCSFKKLLFEWIYFQGVLFLQMNFSLFFLQIIRDERIVVRLYHSELRNQIFLTRLKFWNVKKFLVKTLSPMFRQLKLPTIRRLLTEKWEIIKLRNPSSDDI